MGKQLALVMGEKDEENFLAFLKSKSDIVLIESFAVEKELLFTDHFNNELSGHFHYYIWNKKFKWTPEFSKSIHDTYFVSNTSAASYIKENEN